MLRVDGRDLVVLLSLLPFGCDAHLVVAPSRAAHVHAAAPSAACVVTARRIAPQPLPRLQGFTGVPRVFSSRDPETGDTARAVVRLGPDHLAQIDALPAAFSDTVAATAAHSVLFRFSYEKQIERLVVLPRGGTTILGELEGVNSNDLREAVDGSDGSSVLAILEGATVGLVRIEPGGCAALPTAPVTERAARRVGLSRDTPGTMRVGWVQTSDDRSESSLWVVRASEDGRPLAPPVVVDTAPGEQPVVDAAIGPPAKGPIVAWNPILTRSESADSHDVVLGVSLRVFRLAGDGGAIKVREQSLTSHAGPIASVGGYVLGNHVQALPLRDDVVLS